MSFVVDLPDEADKIEVEAKADGMYVEVEVFDCQWKLIESHTYADGPEADRS